MAKKKSKKDKDFQKVKFKVGKKVAKPDNYTNTAFKSRAVVIREQLKDSANEQGSDYTKHARNPQELLAHLQHYSASFRVNSLNTIKLTMTHEPSRLTVHMAALIDRVAVLASDREKDVRAAVYECLRVIFENLSTDGMQAFTHNIAAHLRCAMTHLSDDVKLDSVKFMNLLVTSFPHTIVQDFYKLLYNFLDLISTKSGSKRQLKVNPYSKLSTVKWRQQVLDNIRRLLLIKTTSSKLITDECTTPSTLAISDDYFLVCSGLTQFSYRRKDMGAEDPTEFQSMMQLITELLPLLTESWVEVQPAPDTMVHPDSVHTMISIVDIINLLSEMVETLDNELNPPLVKALHRQVDTLMKSGFPYCEERAPQRKKQKPTELVHARPSQLNLKLCLLASPSNCCPELVTEYLGRVLESDPDSLDEDWESLLRCLLHQSDSKILEFLCKTSEDRLPLDKLEAFLRFAAQRLKDSSEELTSQLYLKLGRLALSNSSSSAAYGILSLLSKVRRFGSDDFVTLLGEYSTQRGEDDCSLRLVISMLAVVEPITDQVLEALQALVLDSRTNISVSTLVLDILIRRTMAGAIEMSSFLSIVVAVTLSQPLDGTVSLCTVVARRLRHFTNTPQIHQVLEAVFSKKSKMLPTQCLAILSFDAEEKLFSANYAAQLLQQGLTECLRHSEFSSQWLETFMELGQGRPEAITQLYLQITNPRNELETAEVLQLIQKTLPLYHKQLTQSTLDALLNEVQATRDTDGTISALQASVVKQVQLYSQLVTDLR